MSNVADDICADFLVEAQEIMAQLGEQLIELEDRPDDADLINAVFRGFHTIKGGAGFLGFVPMVELTHAIEDRMNDARSGDKPLGAPDFDIILFGLDQLTDMFAAVSAGEQPVKVDAEILRRTRAGEGRVRPRVDGDAPPAPVAAETKAKPSAKRTAAPEPEVTVRVDVKRLDSMVNLVGELVLARNRLKTLASQQRNEDMDRAITALDVTTSRLQTAVMSSRMQPVGRVFSRFPKLVRDIARQLDKQVQLDVIGAETELDRNLVEALADPLVHLIRNAIDHGIESPERRRGAGKAERGQVRLVATQEGDHVAIEVADDGGGIDADKVRESALRKQLISADAAAKLSTEECLNLILLPGFSTRAEVSDLSGRGVGMDVVASRIRELNGQVQIHSELGVGSRFVIRVPLTLAVLPTLLVEVGEMVYALPLVRVIEVLPLDNHVKRTRVDARDVLDLRTQPIPVLLLREWLGLPPYEDGTTGIVLQSGDHHFCLGVDRVRAREEVVIKALPRLLRGLSGYAGASLTGDGRMALILDIDALHATGVAGH